MGQERDLSVDERCENAIRSSSEEASFVSDIDLSSDDTWLIQIFDQLSRWKERSGCNE